MRGQSTFSDLHTLNQLINNRKNEHAYTLVLCVHTNRAQSQILLTNEKSLLCSCHFHQRPPHSMCINTIVNAPTFIMAIISTIFTIIIIIYYIHFCQLYLCCSTLINIIIRIIITLYDYIIILLLVLYVTIALSSASDGNIPLLAFIITII